MAVGILMSKLVGIERRVDEAHIGPISLGIEKTTLRAWHTHHVPKSGKNHAIGASDGNGIIDAAHRQDADGTTRPMDQVNVAWQHILNAVLVNSMCMPTTDLHQLERLVAAQFRNFT